MDDSINDEELQVFMWYHPNSFLISLLIFMDGMKIIHDQGKIIGLYSYLT